jgi:hypothetical protein
MPGLYGNSGRTIMLPPVIRSRSFKLNGIACTLTRNLPASGSGTGTVSSRRTSVGRPYSCVRQARIVRFESVIAHSLTTKRAPSGDIVTIARNDRTTMTQKTVRTLLS